MLLWWFLLAVVVVGSGWLIWNQGGRWAVVCVLLLFALFQISSALYLLPTGYYKGGGDGIFRLHWAWLLHAALWTTALCLTVMLCKRVLQHR